jgi:hypothetical protein
LFLNKLDPWGSPNQLPFLSFVQQPPQSSQRTVRITGGPAESEPLGQVIGYRVKTRTDDASGRQQPPSVLIIRPGLRCEPRRFDPLEKSHRRFLESWRLLWKRVAVLANIGEL